MKNQSGFGISKEIMREKFTSPKCVGFFFLEGDCYIIIYNKKHGKSWREEGKGENNVSIF